MGNDGLSSKQVGSQAGRRVTRRLAWIQPVCISINAVPALKGLTCVHSLRKHWKTHENLVYVWKTSDAFMNPFGAFC